MGQLEKNISWISLFIALAPMLGFMGTVIGMIKAFDKIAAANDMQPSLVAGGIKVALLTTVFGLIVAIILQIFYNYIIVERYENEEQEEVDEEIVIEKQPKSAFTVAAGFFGIKTPDALKNQRIDKAQKDEFQLYKE